MKACNKVSVSILLAGLACGTLAASPSLPHDEFMPPDRHAVRQDKPEQLLVQVDNYRVTVASESRQLGVGRTQESSVWLFLEGRSIVAGDNLQRVRIGFVEGAGNVPPARHDAASQMLTLYYPQDYLEVLTGLLNGPGPHFVQARIYGNGTVWADVHAGPVSVK